MNPRYLTKSRFKLAMECPSKLYYTGKKDQYYDSKLDDEFLKSLAEGGFQVGELAKRYFPGGHDIESLDYDTALEKTNELLLKDNVIIYEAAFRFNNLFIRADILVKSGNKIQLIEVKAKSFDSTTDAFVGKKGANSPAVRSLYEPGLKFEYSGGGISISQQIVMDITHMAYDKYMDEQILKPLGMTTSTYGQPPVNRNQEILATAYLSSGKELPGKFHIYPEQAAAGLWTNPTELAAYIIETQRALEGKSHKVLNQLMTQTRLRPYIDKAAALGVFIDSSDGTKYFQHGGSNEGFKCQYFGSMEGGNGVVIMVNSDNSGIIGELVNSVAKVYGFKGLNKTITKKHINIEDAILDTYTGQYALTSSFILTITKENGGLITQATGQQKVSIYPENQTKFFAIVVDAKLEFLKDPTGKVVSVILYQNGQQHEAKKIK